MESPAEEIAALLYGAKQEDAMPIFLSEQIKSMISKGESDLDSHRAILLQAMKNSAGIEVMRDVIFESSPDWSSDFPEWFNHFLIVHMRVDMEGSVSPRRVIPVLRAALEQVCLSIETKQQISRDAMTWLVEKASTKRKVKMFYDRLLIPLVNESQQTDITHKEYTPQKCLEQIQGAVDILEKTLRLGPICQKTFLLHY